MVPTITRADIVRALLASLEKPESAQANARQKLDAQLQRQLNDGAGNMPPGLRSRMLILQLHRRS